MPGFEKGRSPAEKKTLRASGRFREDVVERREAFRKIIEECVFEKLVYLDECGVNLIMTPRRARAPSGLRAVSVVPYTRAKNVSVLTAMRTDGVVAWNAYDGAVNEERFVAFVEDKLVPTLRPGDVVVLDNVQFHRADAVRVAIEARGARLEFIPPYHPELNANEELFSFFKSLLRRQKPRTIVELIERAKSILDGVGYRRLAAWIRHALKLTAQAS